MPAIPSATETVRDFGLGTTQPAVMTAIIFGYCSGSGQAANTLEFYSSHNALRAALSEGPAVECAANVLSEGGGPVGVIPCSPSIAATLGQVLPSYGANGTNGSITRSGGTTGPAISVSGNPKGSYAMKVEITTGGTLGTALFKWSIDNGSTNVATGVASAASVQLKTATFDSGLTITMPAGTYVVGEAYAWTATPGGGTIAVTGTPALDAHVRIEIMTGGANGTARFRYTCDSYSGDSASTRTYSETLTVPSGGTFVVPNLGITLTFTSTPVFVANDFYEVDVACPAWNASDLALGMAALSAAVRKWRFIATVTSSGNGDATAHAVLAAALQSQLTTLASTSKYRRGMIPGGQGATAAQVVTAFQDVVATRCLVAYGKVKRATAKPFPGFALPVTHSIDVFAARAAASLPSTDLKRVRSGALEEVTKLFHDEYRTPTQLDDVKVSTLRTFDNFDGFYVTQGRLKSPSGSDFTLWPRGIVMDIACETVNSGMIIEIGRGIRTATNVIENQEYTGAIDDRDATAIEEGISAMLVTQLLSPTNAEGFAGHITDVKFTIDRTHNVLADGIILGEVAIQPLGYVDYIRTTLGFVTNLAVAA